MINHKHRFIFVHIIKTGGESIEKFFRGRKIHKFAKNYKKQIGNRRWNNYFKFAFVRNPFSHAVSDYYWRLHLCGQPNISFKEFIYRLFDLNRPDPECIRPPIISNWEIYTIKDSISLDFIGCFERLDKDVNKVSNFIDIPLAKDLKKSKSSIRSRTKSIEEHYDQELIEKVSTIYEKEINHFGYSAFSGLPSKIK